jgi:hypothetical protein
VLLRACDMVVLTEAKVRRPAAEFTDAERKRLSQLLEQYRDLVRRTACGEEIGKRDEQVAAAVLEALWLVEGCWRRDVAAWREMVAVRSRLAKLRATATAEDEVKSGLAGLAELKASASSGRRLFASADPTLFRLRHREQELEVVHPHLFCSVEAAAFLRWDCARRASRW